jgi:hypothetical protein
MLGALAAPVGPPENQSGDGQERFAPTLHNLAIPRRPSLRTPVTNLTQGLSTTFMSKPALLSAGRLA